MHALTARAYKQDLKHETTYKACASTTLAYVPWSAHQLQSNT
jgi:hypothetical protein